MHAWFRLRLSDKHVQLDSRFLSHFFATSSRQTLTSIIMKKSALDRLNSFRVLVYYLATRDLI
jgi:hypothetical protein